VTRAVGLWKEPVLPRGGISEYRFAGVYWFRFRRGARSPARDAGRGAAGRGAGRGRRRSTLKRGGCDYKGGDAVTSSYSRVKQEKAEERESAPRRTHVCNYTTVVPVVRPPSPSPSPRPGPPSFGRDVHSARFPECPLQGGSLHGRKSAAR